MWKIAAGEPQGVLYTRNSKQLVEYLWKLLKTELAPEDILIGSGAFDAVFSTSPLS